MTLPDYAMKSLSFPEMYERWLVPSLFRPWAELILSHLSLEAPARLLDIACGTGIVARLAKERLGDGGRVVGVDLSPPMLAVARALAPTIDWREGNAAALPLADGEQFDFVVCQQGMQFFPDKPAAAAQMHRALAPGGRVAIATWRSLEHTPFFRALHQVAERHVGPITDQRHSFGDPKLLETLLRDTGLQDVQVAVMSQQIHFPDGQPFVRLNTTALVGMSQASKSMADDERQRVVAAIVSDSGEALAPYVDGEELSFELSANLATARR